MNAVKVLASTLVGLAAGAALGILFAPDNGKSTRKKISKESSDYADGLSSKFNVFVDSMTQKFDSLMAETVKAAENNKAKAEKLVNEVATSVNSKVKESSN